MLGIDMNKPMYLRGASFAKFGKGEAHVDRYCDCYVLFLVYKGILRFSEDGVFYEMTPGTWHILKNGSLQKGERASDEPEYFFAHCDAELTDSEIALPLDGVFDYGRIKEIYEEFLPLEYGGYPYVLRCAKFYEVMSELYGKYSREDIADKIADYLRNNYNRKVSLSETAEEFGYCKNQIINIFKRKFSVTPFEYLNEYRMQKAMRLLRETTKPIDGIAYECGFGDYSYFYKAFATRNSLSPSEWRNAQWRNALHAGTKKI